MMAFRMARTHSGKTKVAKFEGAFHGWADSPFVGAANDNPDNGIPDGVRDSMIVLPYDVDAVERTLETDHDIAAVVFQGNQVIHPSFIERLREVTAHHGVMLIFDEVVSGFRWSKGGCQGLYGVTPDLTGMAKILAGGLPGGCVAGAAEIIDTIATGRIAHPGTFNANPLSATAGVACLDHIADGKAHAAANRMGDRLRSGMQKAIDARGLGAEIYGSHSFMHITFTGVRDRSGMGSLGAPLQTAMMLHGVHMGGGGGMTSAVMTEEDIDLTIDAFEQSLGMLGEEGLLVD